MTAPLIRIYRSTKEADLYLYVDSTDDLTRVPEELLRRFGKAELAMTLPLTPERKLARANAAKVLKAVKEQGFYLQLPPGSLSTEAAMQAIRESNSKL